MGGFRYRLIDAAGSELGIIEDDREQIELGDTVEVPESEGGGVGVVVDVYDDEEHGREGGVVATLAVEIG